MKEKYKTNRFTGTERELFRRGSALLRESANLDNLTVGSTRVSRVYIESSKLSADFCTGITSHVVIFSLASM